MLVFIFGFILEKRVYPIFIIDVIRYHFHTRTLRWFLICMKIMNKPVLSFFLNQNVYLDGLSLAIKIITISVTFVHGQF